MVRRLKSELPPKFDGSPRFPKRIIDPLEVPYTAEEKAVHAALIKYSTLRKGNVADATEKLATEFVLKTLKKRLFSSPAAFLATLEQHEKSIRTSKRRKTTTDKPSYGILQRQIEKVEEEYGDDSAAEEAADDAVDTATRLFSEPTAEELALLKQMKAWATSAMGKSDTKVRELIRWLEKTLRPNKKWLDIRVIIFTEYRATPEMAANGSGHGGLRTRRPPDDDVRRHGVRST